MKCHICIYEIATLYVQIPMTASHFWVSAGAVNRYPGYLS